MSSNAGLCALLAALVITWSLLFQSPHTSEKGLGWDGAQYTEVARHCWREPIRALDPFVFRIGAPCLAALLPLAPDVGLQVVNIASAVLLLFLFDAWLMRHLPAGVVRWLLVAFALHWLTPLRQVWWYRTYIDPPALCAMMLALLLRHRWWFAVVCVFGVFVRETVLLVPLAASIGRVISLARDPGEASITAASFAQDKRLRIALLGMAAGAIAMAVSHAVVTPTSDYWMADSALHWAYTKSFPTYALAWFITYGPALGLILVKWTDIKRALLEHPDHAVLLAMTAILAWIGGTDTERFLLWGSPVVLVLIGRSAAAIRWNRAPGALALLAAAQIINGRWFMPIPDYGAAAERVWPLLTPFTARGVELILSQTTDRIVSAMSLAQYFALFVCLIAWLKWRDA